MQAINIHKCAKCNFTNDSIKFYANSLSQMGLMKKGTYVIKLRQELMHIVSSSVGGVCTILTFWYKGK